MVLPSNYLDAGHRGLGTRSLLLTTLRYNALVRDPRATATLTGTMVSRPAGPSFIAQLHEIDDEVERTRRAPPAVNKTLAGAHSFLEKIGQKETAHRREDVNGNTLAAPVYNSTVGTITCIPYNGAACCSHRHCPAVIKAECKSGCCVIPCENCPFLAARLLPYYKLSLIHI